MSASPVARTVFRRLSQAGWQHSRALSASHAVRGAATTRPPAAPTASDPASPANPKPGGLLARMLAPKADGSRNPLLNALGYYSDESRAIGAANTLYKQLAASAAAMPACAPAADGARSSFAARFEMLALHVYIVLRRLRSEKGSPHEGDVSKAMQTMFDVFWTDVRNRMLIKEEGLLLVSSGKWVKECEQRFFGLALALDDCVEMVRAGDRTGGEAAVREVIARNITSLERDPDKVREVADYVMRHLVLHGKEPFEKIWEGGLPWDRQ
jgi:hypothetical protein